MKTDNYNSALSIYDHSKLNPEQIALWVEGETYTYRDLAERAGLLAAWIRREVGTRPERVAILTGRGIAAYQGILGICWAGGCYVPLSQAFPEQRLVNIITRSQPDALIVDKETLPFLSPAVLRLFPEGRVLLADGESTSVHGLRVAGRDDLAAVKSMAAPANVEADGEAYLVFTSGTTGEPSGVVISAGSLSFAVKTLQQRYHFAPGDRFSQFFDLSFDFSVMDLFVPWQIGASTYVVPAARKMGPGSFINEHQLTVWTCVPSMIAIMEKMKMLPPGIFPSLRFSCFSGETLTAVAAQTWQQACPNSIIVNLYGQTEAPIGSLVQVCDSDSPLTEETGGIALGEPLPGLYVDILAGDGRFAEAGTSGELALAGPHLAQGYLDNQERTAEKFRELIHPVYGNHTWYITGDLGRKTTENIFHFLGRADNELKIAGHRFMLEEVEYHLRQASGCPMVAVIAGPPAMGIIEYLIGFVLGESPDEQTLKNELLKILPRPLVPRRIVAIEKIPLSQNGKVDRKALAHNYLA